MAVSVGIWATYGLALALPVLDLPSSGGGGSIDVHGPISGFGALMWGWIPPLCVPWSANLVLIAGWIVYIRRKPTTAFYCAIAAAVLGATTFAIGIRVDSMRPGFLLWELSFGILACAAWAMQARQPD